MRPLATYAATDETSRGRRFPEEHPSHRSEFQRDRDRIIHSTAFRRLEYKTQVFVNHEGDLYRTRLTHSIEVAQIARTIARSMQLNEDLTEAIALAHDLGHTPFGHAGQDALNDCMKDYGGFEHNLQSLRVVDTIEERYATFDGLNLTFETREGILKHCSIANAKELGDVGRRFIEKSQPGLEAQLTNLADEIAYNSHDVDDGLRSGLISMDQLREVRMFREPLEEVQQLYPDLDTRRTIYEVVRRIINNQVVDLIETSRASLKQAQPDSIDDVRNASENLISFSPEMREQNLELKRFLRTNLYQHYRVYRMSSKAVSILRELFHAFMNDPRLLPPESGCKAQTLEKENGEAGKARAVTDYIAGMTDRYAIREHQRIFQPDELT
jgi:dGTPase